MKATRAIAVGTQREVTTIRADAVAPQPWRNGGGRTRELLARPAGPEWRVRVSLADIERDGPFSAFDGIGRWFAVVQGDGVVLHFGPTAQLLRPGAPPLHFDGAAAPGCTLLGGPTRDLNLMHRAGDRSTMVLVRAADPWHDDHDERGLYARVAGRCFVDDGGEGIAVAADTLLWDLGDGPCRFEPEARPDQAGAPCGWWLGWSAGAPA